MYNKITALKSLNEFKELKHNWNGYDAVPIKESIIEKAINFLQLIDDEIEIEVFPVPRGYIQFEFGNRENYLEIEILDTHFNVLIKLNNTEYEVEKEININSTEKMTDIIKNFHFKLNSGK